ncbi:LysR substrate-binding domain-containing protein [Vibrio sp.]|nr:LysR substrate-binding domain-containing protein [Vibrio sp.]
MKRIDDLLGLQVFEKVVSLGSLTLAASALDISLAAASKRLANLESRVGVQLVYRNTRKLSITDDGILLYDYASRIINELNSAEEALLKRSAIISGELKITASYSIGRRYLAHLIPKFCEEYPDIDIVVRLTDDVLDIVSENIDVAIRIGELADSRLVASRLMNNKRVLCASPHYISRFGQPKSLEELENHNCIVLGDNRNTIWRFDSHNVHIHGKYSCNDGETAHILTINGLGIALKSFSDVMEDLERGNLVQLLPELTQAAAPIHAVFMKQTELAPRVRVFVDYLKAHFEEQSHH